MDVGTWLRGLGLERYEAAFRENEIDETVLPTLTADDLKDLGVGVVGHRRKLLNAIAALRGDANTKVPVMKRNGQRAPRPPRRGSARSPLFQCEREKRAALNRALAEGFVISADSRSRSAVLSLR